MKKIVMTIHAVSELLVKFNTVILIPFFIFLVTFDVIVLRFMLNRPLAWGSELEGYLLLLLFFLCVTKCEDDDEHIRMEILYQYFPPRCKIFVDIIGLLIGITFFSVLSYQSFLMVPEMYEINQTGIEFLWPLWPLRLALSVFSALCAVRIFFKIMEKICRLIAGFDPGQAKE